MAQGHMSSCHFQEVMALGVTCESDTLEFKSWPSHSKLYDLGPLSDLRAWVCEFPVSAVTKDHKLDGLKQPAFILSHFGGQNPKIKGSAGPPPKALGEDPSRLSASGGSRCPLACDSITPASASIFTWLLLCFCVLSSFFLAATWLVGS